MKRKKLIAANWKMNKTVSEAEDFLDELSDIIQDNELESDVLICPPFTSLNAAHKKLKDKKIMVGAQNVYFESSGAFTGEISPSMIKEFCTHVIIGHSERRNIFNEGNEDVSKKAFVAINNNLNVIICVGESLEQREQDRHLEVVSNQLSACLKNIMKKDIHRVIIAYEPVWAIGTGKNATASQAEEMHKHIRSKIKEIYDDEIAENTRILYGGSVSIENYEEILSSDEVDGALIGGTSLDPEKFGKIAKFSSQS